MTDDEEKNIIGAFMDWSLAEGLDMETVTYGDFLRVIRKYLNNKIIYPKREGDDMRKDAIATDHVEQTPDLIRKILAVVEGEMEDIALRALGACLVRVLESIQGMALDEKVEFIRTMERALKQG